MTEEHERHDDHRTDTRETCVVCLQTISERAVIYPCNHLSFDFLCLAAWLEQRPTCPLCNIAVQRVEYDWRAPHDFKVYTPSPVRFEESNSAPSSSRNRRFAHARVSSRGGRGRHHPLPPSSDSSSDTALARRRLVHARGAYSLHRASHTAITPVTFRASPIQQRKARLFLRRELHVFTHLTSSNRIEFVLEYIVGMLRRMQIKGADGAMEGLVAEVLGQDGARLLLHELAAWLSSSFERLEDWDRFVQYADQDIMRYGERHGGSVKHDQDRNGSSSRAIR